MQHERVTDRQTAVIGCSLPRKKPDTSSSDTSSESQYLTHCWLMVHVQLELIARNTREYISTQIANQYANNSYR